LIISLNPEFKDIQLDRTKVSHYKNFFKLEKNFDFNTLAFFLDRKEYGNQYVANGKIKLCNFDVFDEGKFFCNFIKELLLNKNYKTIDTYIFASLSKIALSENHVDKETVFLFSVLGSVIYNVYDQTNFTSFYMNVGDLLIIPKEVVHAAIPLCPRIVVSVGVYD
jgi:hypothetical protein